jgi:hypothetical protein
VYFDGYWIKYYEPPTDSLAAKKALIEALSRRLFNHMEHGINMPGNRLEEARRAYNDEHDPERKRVNGAMLAGALFNRATDIFRKLVELQECGVEIGADNELMHECGRCLVEALEFGKMVHHRSGEESIDEMWGEPFRAFSMPVEAFYESRYIKIAQAMRAIDRIADEMVRCFEGDVAFAGLDAKIREFADVAKRKCETLRTDPVIFQVWPAFVVIAEHLTGFKPRIPPKPTEMQYRRVTDGVGLVSDGKCLLTYIARARVLMAKSTKDFLARCEQYQATHRGAHTGGVEGGQ